MKCKNCKSANADFTTTNGDAICQQCVTENNYVVCTRCGKIVLQDGSTYPYSEPLCSECFSKEND